MGNNYQTIESIKRGEISVVNYNLEKLFEAINHVELDINKPIMQMEEEEIQQLGHCFFVAFDSPFDVTPGTIPPEEDIQF